MVITKRVVFSCFLSPFSLLWWKGNFLTAKEVRVIMDGHYVYAVIQVSDKRTSFLRQFVKFER